MSCAKQEKSKSVNRQTALCEQTISNGLSLAATVAVQGMAQNHFHLPIHQSLYFLGSKLPELDWEMPSRMIYTYLC